jgi:hypothetical protein
LAASASRETLIRPLEDVFLSRLEFLVDLIALRKPHPGRYQYEWDDRLAPLRALLSGDADDLNRKYFGLVVARARSADALERPDEVLEHIRPAVKALRGLTGYSGITESVILANMTALSGSDPKYVEVDVCITGLRQLAANRGAKIRLIADRFRRPRDVAILESA